MKKAAELVNDILLRDGGMGSRQAAVILLGPPGSGKTTVVDSLSASGECAPIKTGHLLRKEAEAESALGRQIRSSLDAGLLVPTPLVAQTIGRALQHATVPTILFDGFPRSREQVEPFFRLLNDSGLHLLAVAVLTLSDEEIKRRLTGRRVCPQCGATYNLDGNRPVRNGVCDECASKLVQRRDDAPQGVEERLGTYRKETIPVIEFFKTRHPDITHELLVEKGVDRAIELLRDRILRNPMSGPTRELPCP